MKGEDAHGENEGEEEEEKYETMSEFLFRHIRGVINSNMDLHHEIP